MMSLGEGSYPKGTDPGGILARRQDCHVMTSGCGRPVARQAGPMVAPLVHTLQLERGRFNETLKVSLAFLVRL